MPETFKPTVNIPFAMHIKYVDVYPNDPSKDPKGKGYGPSLSLRGDIDGTDSRCYPKGFLDANLKGMVNAGIIEADNFDYDPEEKYSIPVVAGDVTITLSQPAGERYAKTVFATSKSNGKPPVQSAPKHSGNIGGPLPGEYDDDDSGYLDAVAGDPAPTATAVRPVVAHALAPNNYASKMQQVEAQYLSALTFVLDKVIPRLAKADIPVDGSAVNAMCATLCIGASK